MSTSQAIAILALATYAPGCAHAPRHHVQEGMTNEGWRSLSEGERCRALRSLGLPQMSDAHAIALGLPNPTWSRLMGIMVDPPTNGVDAYDLE